MNNNLLVIIPCAGIGNRFSSQIEKQHASLGDLSVIETTLDTFMMFKPASKIVVVATTTIFEAGLNIIKVSKVVSITDKSPKLACCFSICDENLLPIPAHGIITKRLLFIFILFFKNYELFIRHSEVKFFTSNIFNMHIWVFLSLFNTFR